MPTTKTILSSFGLVALTASFLQAAEAGGEWVNLFNGKDLSNWVNVNGAPETWTVAGGVVKCTGVPTGAMRTPKMYENFILEVEWRHLKSGGNAGIFVWSSPIQAPGVPFLRAIEVQVLDTGYGNTKSHTTHGDVFPIHGSTMVPFGAHQGMRSFPSEQRSKPSPEWNHYRIEARNGVLRLSVNGREVSGGEKCVWRKGYLGLESEGSPVEWRGLRIQELPSTGATEADSAPVAGGHRSLYNGLDLRGWKTEGTDEWTSADWTLMAKPPAGGAKPLWTEATFGDLELIVDHKAGAPGAKPRLLLRGPEHPAAGVDLPVGQKDKWERYTVNVRGRDVTLSARGETQSFKLPESTPAKGAIGLHALGGPGSFGNIFVLEK